MQTKDLYVQINQRGKSMASKIDPKDINIMPEGHPHRAEHRVNGKWKKWIGHKELESIVAQPLRKFIKKKTQEVKKDIQ